MSVPFLYLFVEDVQLGEQEKEGKMREMGGEILMGDNSVEREKGAAGAL